MSMRDFDEPSRGVCSALILGLILLCIVGCGVLTVCWTWSGGLLK